MNLELTIQDLFDRFPKLFKVRSDCFNHLFCTIGNGYEWKDGELVELGSFPDSIRIEYLNSQLVDGKAFQHNKLTLRDEAVMEVEKEVEKYKEAAPEIQILQSRFYMDYIRSFPPKTYHSKPRSERWSRSAGHGFTFLIDHPDNISPDWLAGIKECEILLQKDGIYIKEVDIQDEDFH